MSLLSLTVFSFFLLMQSSVQTELVKIQPNFKGGLLDSVEVFKDDSNGYTDEYETVSKKTRGSF